MNTPSMHWEPPWDGPSSTRPPHLLQLDDLLGLAGLPRDGWPETLPEVRDARALRDVISRPADALDDNPAITMAALAALYLETVVHGFPLRADNYLFAARVVTYFYALNGYTVRLHPLEWVKFVRDVAMGRATTGQVINMIASFASPM